MDSDKKAGPSGQWRVSRQEDEPDLGEGVPVSVREARRARKLRDDLWPYVWMTFASILVLAVALAILSYRFGAQSCH
jgi:hypothetical protein